LIYQEEGKWEKEKEKEKEKRQAGAQKSPSYVYIIRVDITAAQTHRTKPKLLYNFIMQNSRTVSLGAIPCPKPRGSFFERQ